jgi:hypothetical protein
MLKQRLKLEILFIFSLANIMLKQRWKPKKSLETYSGQVMGSTPGG